MNVKTLKYDGRCKWLEKKVLDKLVPLIMFAKYSEDKKTMYIIEDWVSNDNGKVGVDLEWLDKLGIPVIKNINELPSGTDYVVVNTGYDSIVHEEKSLQEKGIEIIDEPCPYVRKLRKIFESPDSNFQYVLLCEPNHIIMKNYYSLFPEDMILVQMNNYQELISSQANGKPMYLIPYVTFLPKHIDEIFNHIQTNYTHADNKVAETSCMWISSPVSPVVEINELGNEDLADIQDALLITTPGSTNKSLISLTETLEEKKLNVVIISSLQDFIDYEKSHSNDSILLVKSPIPNNAERMILDYLKKGYVYSYLQLFKKNVFQLFQKQYYQWYFKKQVREQSK